MGNVVALNPAFGPVSTVFAGRQIENAAAAGIQGSYGHIGYRGKNWSIRYQGNERVLTNPDGSPQWSLELVVLRAAVPVSKIFYRKWVEGSHDAPECFSTNGLMPDPSAKEKQAASCKVCPANVWGSRITEAGKPGKLCRDSRRLAVVPANSIKNEALGGPMLLRVPAASLADYAEFSRQMERQGYPYNAFVTRVAFDTSVAYPKFVFSAVRPLNDAEAAEVMEWYDSAEVERLLSEDVLPVMQALPAPANSPFEQAAPAPAPAPAPAAAPAQSVQGTAQGTMTGFGGPPVSAAPAPAPAAAPAANAQENTPVAQQTTTVAQENAATGATSFDAQLDALLGDAA